jgi:hypothetical protein
LNSFSPDNFLSPKVNLLSPKKNPSQFKLPIFYSLQFKLKFIVLCKSPCTAPGMCPTSDFFHFWNFRNSKLTKINFHAVPKFQFLDYKVPKSVIKIFFLPFYFRLPIFFGFDRTHPSSLHCTLFLYMLKKFHHKNSWNELILAVYLI